MKRVIALMALACLLLTGCQIFDKAVNVPNTDPSTQPATQETTQATEATEAATVPVTTEAPTLPATEPTKPAEQTVTVYLLEKAAHVDSGYTDFRYDMDYNLISFKTMTIENQLRYSGSFEDPDNNGMPAKAKVQWPEMEPRIHTLTYFADGKLDSVDDGTFSGFQRSYNEKGDINELREYYEGVLQDIVIYEYANGILKSVRCETATGEKIYECKVEKGRIVERVSCDSDDPYSYTYKYDKNGNLIEVYITIEGETMLDSKYTYKAVKVSPQRAAYLQQQQSILFLYV